MVLNLSELEIDGYSDNGILSGAKKVILHIRPSWETKNLKFKIYTDGITNKLIGVWNEDFNEQVLIRVYGDKTELFIDRTAELKNMKLLFENNCGTEIFASFKNGLSYAFIPGEVTTTESIKREDIFTAVGKEMAKFHSIKVPASNEACLFPKLNRFIGLLPDAFKEDFSNRLTACDISKSYLKRESKELEKVLSALNCPVVFCHNDLLLNNVIWVDKTKSVRFIDYEYAAPNYQAFDIGNHFCEFSGVSDEMELSSLYPDAEFQRRWIRNYLACYNGKGAHEITEEEVEKWRRWVNKFALGSYLLWGAWGLLQACHSTIDFDFLRFGIDRILEYKRRKDEFLGL